MYIKRIVIQGFKTYKNTTVIDLVSPHHNVVVGRNGSGKSNFFSAIRFVLSDAYTHMSREERQGLIHEGSGTVMSAYVEIIFDNTDRRLPISKDEVAVRRTIGLKKDDYSLDGKSATRSDVMNLLESAGFSRSNPYYIVPQGKITALTNSKDSERLALLKDVSGAKIFEAKLKESLKEMDHSNLKRQRIDETLSTINERLTDLQIESNDLKDYQQLDKVRKILEFNLFDRELNDINEELDKLEEKYTMALEKSQEDLQTLEAREKSCQALSESISDLKNKLKLINLEKDQNHMYYNQLLTSISSKEVKLDELRAEMSSVKSKRENLINSVKHYQELISKTKNDIASLKPTVENLHSQESSLKKKLVELSTRQRALYSKQSRFQKFANKSQRDKWLNEQISKILKDLNTKEVEIKRLSDTITEKEEAIMELEHREEDLTEQVNNDALQLKMNDIQQTINALKLQISDISDKRKSLWRDEIRYKSINDSLTNDLNNASNIVNQTMDRYQSQGLQAVKDLTEKFGLQNSVFGPLAELFNVSDKYKTAVEVVAANSLFHVVVDTDETASILMEELIRNKSGRVTFMPLNRLNPPQVDYPNSSEHQCIPLIKKIKPANNKHQNVKIQMAINQVFGRTIVVSDLTRGSELAKAYNLNAITLDGDRVDIKGALTGGYRDYKASRIDAIKSQLAKKHQLVENASKLKLCEHDILQINQQITDLNNQLQANVRELDKQAGSVEPVKAEISQIQSRRYNLQQELNSLKSNLEAVVTVKHNLATNLHEHEQELKSEFTQALSDEEHDLMKTLTEEINRYETELNKVVSKSADLETQLSKYESDLSINYRPHLSKLINESSNPTSIGMKDFEIDELTFELQRLHEQLNGIKSKNHSIDEEINSLETQIEEHEAELKNANEEQLKIMQKLEKFSKSTEKNLNKKAILNSRRDEVQKKIRNIGVLPEEAFDHEKYEAYGSDQLLAQLKETNNNLKKYSHINKKAIEQYGIFTTQRDDLVTRRAELDESKDSINKLIKNLELQKDEAITKSFKAVASSFSEVFETLVPAGVGKLIMQRSKNASNDDDEDNMRVDSVEMENLDEDDGGEGRDTEDIDMEAKRGIEDYVGVSISVSFNSKHDEQQRIEQLSGGQKSLCAIALILAIQKCDPAPFYLFDEIDANLDTQYRTAVASMINSLSNSAQFICTTFRPEMLQVAHKFYGVTFSNKVSTVSEITRDVATTFVEGQRPN